MAKYTSKFKELGFYVNGELRRFTSSEYNTTDKDEISALDKLTDAQRVDEAKAEVNTVSKPEAKTAPKAPTRKSSAK